MKEPCLTCPYHIEKTCNRNQFVCPRWIDWLFTKEKGRNSVQMRITQYTEREE